MAKGGAAKFEQQKEEDLDGREDGRRVGVQRDVDLVAQAQDEAVGGEQPCPEQERAFLSGPERGELVERRQGRGWCGAGCSRRRSRW